MKFPEYSKEAARESWKRLPRLSMDEYLEMMQAQLAGMTLEEVERQKQHKKDIKVVFRLIDE